ncbi:MAG: hypothetical protein IT458_07025 [Planctomycetes bacterium]|nr:hypothetical protein [Planctomycetota bacterium]
MSHSPPRRLPLLLLVASAALLGAALFAWSEAGRLRERQRLLADRVASLTAERDRAQGEVLAALEQRRAMADQLAAVRAQIEAERARAEQEVPRFGRAMPAGVRLALERLTECLRHDGHETLRFLHADALQDLELRGAEIVDHDARTFAATLYVADRVGFELDRTQARLTLVLREGASVTAEGRTPLPAEGLRVQLGGVDARFWEERLPMLVRVSGEHPRPGTAGQAPRPDPGVLATWIGRCNRVLAGAETETRWEVGDLRGVHDGHFEQVLVLGYTKGRLLESSAEAKRMWLRADRGRGTVELVLAEGILRRRGGETALPDSGYAILLHGVTPQQAQDWMLGMVSER